MVRDQRCTRGTRFQPPLRNTLSLASGFLTLTSGTQADSKISFILCIVIISNNTTQIISFQGYRCNNNAMDPVMNTMLCPFCSDMATTVISNNTPLIFEKKRPKLLKDSEFDTNQIPIVLHLSFFKNNDVCPSPCNV